MADKNQNKRPETSETSTSDANSLDEQGAKYSETERDSMRSKVLSWLKNHPESTAKNGNMVVVPKQKRRFKWPWSKQKSASIKPKPVATIAKKTEPEAPKNLPQKPTEDIQPIISDNQNKEIETPEIKPVENTGNKKTEPVWPPAVSPKKVVEQEVAAQTPETIADKPAPIKMTETTLIDETHDSLLEEGEDLLPEGTDLLTEGEDLISEDEHSRIVEIIEEDLATPTNNTKKETVANNVQPNKRTSRLPKLNLQRTYKTVWALFIIVSLVGVLSPFFNAGSVFANFTPTPYAIVGNTVVMRNSFDKELSALKNFHNSQQSLEIDEESLKNQVEGAIIRRTIAVELASEQDIWISQKEINAELDKIIEQAGSLEQVQSTVKNLWGWSLDEYKHYIIRPLLVKRAVQAKLSEDIVLRTEVGQQGDMVQFDKYLDSLRESYRIIIF